MFCNNAVATPNSCGNSKQLWPLQIAGPRVYLKICTLPLAVEAARKPRWGCTAALEEMAVMKSDCRSPNTWPSAEYMSTCGNAKDFR